MSSSSPLGTATTFRSLTWSGAVPLQISLAVDSAAGAGESYFIQAPRNSYLPQYLQEVREGLVELALSDEQLAASRQSDWWFEDATGGGRARWHWPIGLIYDHSSVNNPSLSTSLPPTNPPPLRLTLHLVPQERPALGLATANSLESCRIAYMSALKEGDFVRWGSTKRVNGLKRADQDALWSSLLSNDFDTHHRVLSKLLPLPNLPPSAQPDTPGLAPGSRPPSAEPGQQGQSSIGVSSGKPDSAYAVRSVPMKVVLPEGAGVLQEVIPPLSSTGQPTTLLSVLQLHVPLLFPPGETYSLAFPLVQGVVPPPETEAAWLGACFAGADGWVGVCVCLR